MRITSKYTIYPRITQHTTRHLGFLILHNNRLLLYKITIIYNNNKKYKQVNKNICCECYAYEVVFYITDSEDKEELYARGVRHPIR